MILKQIDFNDFVKSTLLTSLKNLSDNIIDLSVLDISSSSLFPQVLIVKHYSKNKYTTLYTCIPFLTNSLEELILTAIPAIKEEQLQLELLFESNVQQIIHSLRVQFRGNYLFHLGHYQNPNKDYVLAICTLLHQDLTPKQVMIKLNSINTIHAYTNYLRNN